MKSVSLLIFVCLNMYVHSQNGDSFEVMGRIAFTDISDRSITSSEPENDNWWGWRGNEKGGSLKSGDLKPDKAFDHYVAWKTEIRGDGHSSPIVVGDSVIVTSAYRDDSTARVLRAVNFSMFGFLVLVNIMACFLHMGYQREQSANLFSILRVVSFGFAMLMLNFMVLWGKNTLDFSRCPIRSFLAATVFTAFGIYAMGILRFGAKRIVEVAFLMMTCAAVLVLTPHKDHVFRGGLLSNNSMVAYSVALLPLLLIAFLLLSDKLASSRLENSEELRFKSLMPSMAVLAGLVGIVWASVAFLVTGSEYFSYHLGDPDFSPVLGRLSIGVLAIIVAQAFLWALKTGGNIGKIPGKIFPIAMMAMIGLFWFASNGIHQQSRLVRAISSYDLSTGRLQWISEGLIGHAEGVNRFNSPATPTPVSDGKRIYAWFGTAGAMATDLEGRLLWENKNLPNHTHYGASSSPAVGEGIVVIQSGTRKKPYLTGLDTNTGQRVWTQELNENADYLSGTNRTPILHNLNGKWVVLVWGISDLTAYDLSSGEPVWDYPTEESSGDMVSSPITDGSRLYLANPDYMLAVDIKALGGASLPVLWQTEEIGPNCSSLVLAGNKLFSPGEDGDLRCFDAKTGELLKTFEVGGLFFASPVVFGDHIYLSLKTGSIMIINTSTLDVVNSWELNEDIYASIALQQDRMLLRTTKQLYCLSASK